MIDPKLLVEGMPRLRLPKSQDAIFYGHLHKTSVLKLVSELPQSHEAAISLLDDAKRLLIHLRDHGQEIFAEPASQTGEG